MVAHTVQHAGSAPLELEDGRLLMVELDERKGSGVQFSGMARLEESKEDVEFSATAR